MPEYSCRLVPRIALPADGLSQSCGVMPPDHHESPALPRTSPGRHPPATATRAPQPAMPLMADAPTTHASDSEPETASSGSAREFPRFQSLRSATTPRSADGHSRLSRYSVRWQAPPNSSTLQSSALSMALRSRIAPIGATADRRSMSVSAVERRTKRRSSLLRRTRDTPRVVAYAFLEYDNNRRASAAVGLLFPPLCHGVSTA